MAHNHSTTTTCPNCQAKDEELREARWDAALNMYRPAGLAYTIRTRPADTTYTIVLCDIDRLKDINSATGNHIQTNRYLAAGLTVREGEVVGQLFGDEFLFILDEQSRDTETDAHAFIARIARQLAGQPLTISERYALAAAQGCHVSQAKLSATFATQSSVAAHAIMSTIEQLSTEVLHTKKVRDAQ